MSEFLRSLRDVIVSMRLTVVLLLLGMILVFVATIDQVHLGVWAVQEKYFRSFIVYTQVGGITIPMFPGGYLIGGLFLINLIGAHFDRFKPVWRKSGIALTHFGLVMLLIGELLSGLWQEDYNMRLSPGETKNYSESYRANELVFINTSDPKFDEVVSIPETLLAREGSLQHPKLSFRVAIKHYYPNSSLEMRGKSQTAAPSEATAGIGPQLIALPLPMTYKQDEHNNPTAFVELLGPDGSLGTYLVSTELNMPQPLEVGGQKWKIALRAKRAYKPFSLTLVKFSHDRYPGTEIPKNFSSRIHLTTPDGRDDRDVLIYMNNPLRYGGYTFYQHQMEAARGLTGLQVVRNPGWLLPYIACVMMTLGLVLQFGLSLFAFNAKRRAKAAAQPKAA